MDKSNNWTSELIRKQHITSLSKRSSLSTSIKQFSTEKYFLLRLILLYYSLSLSSLSSFLTNLSYYLPSYILSKIDSFLIQWKIENWHILSILGKLISKQSFVKLQKKKSYEEEKKDIDLFISTISILYDMRAVRFSILYLHSVQILAFML